jgi:acetyl-CoA acyltransferase
MGLTAENVAKDYKVSREDQDAFAYESNIKASAAIEKGLFRDEIIPVPVTSRRPKEGGGVEVTERLFDRDEGPRPDTTKEALAQLRPAFLTGGSVTAGNSSQMSDGAGICLVASEEFVKKHNLKPAARFVAFSVAGVPPRVMGIGPIAAIPKVLRAGGIKLDEVAHIELNEAFAAQSLAVMRELKVDPARVNPTGGAIALGHPLGATGAKLMATCVHGLHRNGGRYGLVTMCIGTGMGAACLIERV